MLTIEQAEQAIRKEANGLRITNENYRELAQRVHPIEKQVILPPMPHHERQELLLASYAIPERYEAHRANQFVAIDDWSGNAIRCVILWQEWKATRAWLAQRGIVV